jgi:quinolinate synthase
MAEEHKFVIPEHKYTEYSLAMITLGYEKEKGFCEAHQPFNGFKRHGIKIKKPEIEEATILVPVERPESTLSVGSQAVKKVSTMEMLLKRRLKK